MTDPSATDASAPSGASVAIPEAAYEAAVLSARRGLQVGARFLVAAELERLKTVALEQGDYYPDRLADLVNDRISELRGETVE